MGFVQLDALLIGPEKRVVNVVVAAAVGVERLAGAPCLILWRLHRDSNMADCHRQPSQWHCDARHRDHSNCVMAWFCMREVKQTVPHRAVSSCR